MDLQELQTLAEREQEILDAPCIRCCTVGGCLSANALAVKEQIEVEIATQDLNPPMQVRGWAAWDCVAEVP